MAKQNNPITPVPYNFGDRSGIVSDGDIKDVAQGKFPVTGIYTGCQNMRNMGAGLNVSPGYEPVEGNEYQYTPTAPVVQNKKWRFYLDLTDVPVITPDNLVVNGDFASGTGWTTGTNWAIGAGVATHTPGAAGILLQTIDTAEGVFDFSVTISGITAGTVTLVVNGVTYNTYNSNGTKTESIVTDGTPVILQFLASAACDASLDDVSMVRIAYGYLYDYELTTPSDTVLLSGSSAFYFSNDISNSLTNLETQLQTDFTAYTPLTTLVVESIYTGYVELELSIVTSFNYGLSITETVSNDASLTLVVSQEAIDVSMVSEWNLIGSCDRTGDGFKFFTTRNTLPVEYDIINVSDNAGIIVIETTEPHGLIDGMAVRVQSVVGVSEANGDWITQNCTTFTFELALSAFVGPTYISGGTVSKFIYGLGEIGVVVKNDLGDIEYTRLIRSSEFNFTTLHQVDVRVKRKQDERKAAYFTDGFNVPRIFYYKGDYVTDGAIQIVSPENIYDYGNVASEVVWILNNEDFSIEFERQDQVGGSLKSGNWRYAIRFLTQDFTRSNWSQLTDTVSVYAYSQDDINIIGSNPDTPTSKVNVLKINNNTTGIYKYVEIAALNYINDFVPQGYIIGRYLLSGDIEQFISHTGNEPNLVDLDVAEVNDVQPGFTLAKNVELLDNRAILSNLTPSQFVDFSAWVRTFKYSLERDRMGAVGYWDIDGGASNGEYQYVNNIYYYKSHMMMETYRYGFRFKLKNGSLTQVFYPGYDIKIDLPATLPQERVAGTFTSFDLTSESNSAIPDDVYFIYIKWQNINLDFSINGVPASSLIDEIIPCRAKVVPEVIMHGMIALGVDNNSGDADEANAPDLDPAFIINYPYVSGDPNITSDIYPGTTSGGGASFSEQRESAFLFAPDYYFDLIDMQYQSGDQLYVFGQPKRFSQGQSTISDVVNDAVYSEYDGYTGVTVNPTAYEFVAGVGAAPSNHPIRTAFGTGVNSWSLQPAIILDSLTHYAAAKLGSTAGLSLNVRQSEKCFVMRFTTPIADNSVNPDDYGFYRAIYYRPLTNKYGDPNDTIYYEFLKPYRVGSNTGIVDGDDFPTYGDVFTQKSYIKYRYPAHWQQSTTQWLGWGASVAFYSQNRNNIQMRCYASEDSNIGYRIPEYGWGEWSSYGWTLSSDAAAAVDISKNIYVGGIGKDASLFYNLGYTPSNGIQTEVAFNTSATSNIQTDWGNGLGYSDLESEGSNTDNLRNFPPFNLKFLDYTDGAITDARAINGELITIQPRSVQRQYFNTTAIITTQDGGEAQLGTGAVLSRRGTVMNKYGSNNKWSVIVGLSDKGHDVLYAIDTTNKAVWRLGYDGTNTLDEIHGMKSFFANYLNWVRNYDTPAHGEGICGVANQRFKEVIWTMRGQKPVDAWTDREEEYTILTFESSLGNNLLSNPNFNGSIGGWDSLDNLYAPDASVWTYFLNGTDGVARHTSIAPEGYLAQSTPLTLNVGEAYQLILEFNQVLTDPVEISFQQGGGTIYAYGIFGQYFETYIPQSGDDNLYIYQPAGGTAQLTSASLRKIITLGWNGGGDWIIGNNEASTIAGGTALDLGQTVADYIVAGDDYIIDVTIKNYVGGDLRIKVGDTFSSALGISADGTYQVAVTPSATGVITFSPVGGNFEGTVKGNIRVKREHPTTYYRGDVVSVPGDGTNSFELFNDLYICIVDEVSGAVSPVGSADWELLPHTDPDYYNEYTIVFAENKDTWSMFLTPKPKIYAKFLDTYFTPRPVSDTGRIYLADSGSYMTWYEDGVTNQSANGFIDPVINQPMGRKRYLSARIESDIAPYQMDVITTNNTNSTPNSEMIQREGAEFDAYVKSNSITDSISWGDYGIFRFIVRNATYNKINSFIAKVRVRARAWFS